jgi:methionyl-tRNA synthetase
VSTETDQTVEWMEEENYKFRLSAFQEALIEWLKSNPEGLIISKYHTRLSLTVP